VVRLVEFFTILYTTLESTAVASSELGFYVILLTLSVLLQVAVVLLVDPTLLALVVVSSRPISVLST
jgi:hypothetical protein